MCRAAPKVSVLSPGNNILFVCQDEKTTLTGKDGVYVAIALLACLQKGK